MDAKVVLVVEAAFVIPVTEPVVSNFFRDRRRVFAEVACDVLEGSSFDQLLLDVFSIFQREVFLVAGNVFAHDRSFPCCQKEGFIIPWEYEKVKSTCAELKSTTAQRSGI